MIHQGMVLQPVLYALVLEKLLKKRSVSGRLHYCTAEAGFAVREVPVDEAAREAAARLTKTIDSAIADGFLPAASAPDACDFCDFRSICGPYEAQRTRRKPSRDLEALTRLRRER